MEAYDKVEVEYGRVGRRSGYQGHTEVSAVVYSRSMLPVSVGKQVNSRVCGSRPDYNQRKSANCRLSVDPRFSSRKLAQVRNGSQSLLESLVLTGDGGEVGTWVRISNYNDF